MKLRSILRLRRPVYRRMRSVLALPLAAAFAVPGPPSRLSCSRSHCSQPAGFLINP